MTIWDFGNTVHHLQMVCKGSLSHNRWILLLFLPFFVQSALQARKILKMREMVGENREEEEPEGEVVECPSGEAVMYSSCNMSLFFSFSLLLFYFFFKSLTILTIAYSSTIEWISLLCLVSLSHIPDQILLIDESDEEVVKMERKEEQKLGCHL